MAKKKTKKKSSKLRKVPAKDYTVAWNKKRTKCALEHKSGKGGETCMGLLDFSVVFTDGKTICLLSVNYLECYACVECFDDEGMFAMCYANPEDCLDIFGTDMSKMKPKDIAERLLKEC